MNRRKKRTGDRILPSNANGTSVNHDNLNRVSTVTDNHPGAGTTTYSYDARNLEAVLYPSGVRSSYTYDSLDRLTNLTAAKATTLASYAYLLGPAGESSRGDRGEREERGATMEGFVRASARSQGARANQANVRWPKVPPPDVSGVITYVKYDWKPTLLAPAAVGALVRMLFPNLVSTMASAAAGWATEAAPALYNMEAELAG